MQQARVRGTAVHSLCEKYIRNDPEYSRGHMPSNIYTFTTIRKFLDRRIGTVRAIEAPLYSKRLMTAGRSDMIAEVDLTLSIVDYKTGTRVKTVEDIESYFIQATCYGEMFEELTGIPIPRITVVMAPDESSEPIVYARDRSDYRDRMLDIFVNSRKCP
jgi:genome maintenance exonuclease 1